MWNGKEGVKIFFSLKAIIILSLPVSMLRSIGLLNVAPDVNRDLFHFLSPLEGDPHTFIHPLTHKHTHTPEIPPLPPQDCFLPASLCEETLSSMRVRRTHFLCQIASHIPHSPSICLVQAIFSSFLLLLSFLVSLWGALCASGSTKNWFIPWVKHDPQEHNAFLQHTHTLIHTFQGARAGENKFLAVKIHYFWAHTHTDRWTVNALMKADGCIYAHTHTRAVAICGTQQMSVGKLVSRVKI